jgi:subtilisin family serine protease
MTHNNLKSAKSCGFLRRIWPILALFTLTTFVYAAEKNQANNSAQFTSGTASDAKLESRQLGENEAQMVITQDGKVVAESTYQLQEVDIIVQFNGEPVLSQRNASRAEKVSRFRELKLQMNPLKSRIVQAENAVRKQNGNAVRLDEDVIKGEFVNVFNGVAARVHKEAIKDIEKISGVKKVWRDGKVKALDNSSNSVIGAPQVWSNLGITGAGIVVAIVDTGIDYTHPDLGGCLGPTCKVIAGYDFVNSDADPKDDHGHGTHCAGIVAANGTLRGVAPDAKLMAAKVLDSGGSGSWSNIISGIEWATNPDGNPATDDGADVISMSLGGSGTPDDPVAQAVDNAVTAGVVVAVAAGNSGPNYETVQSPGVARKALTVGATDNSDQLASFSSRGPVPGTWQMKPEVTAPGVSIYSTYLNGGYVSMSGTSMATPHVAGAAALLRQLYPSASPEWIKSALMQKATNLGLNALAQGSGRINVYSSATLAALASSSVLNLGVDDKTQPNFIKSELVSLTNQSATSQTYNLSIIGTLPAGVTTNITPSSLTLAPGETKSFAFDLSADNSITPDSMTTLSLTQPYDFEGRIEATTGTDTIRLPFTFFKAPMLTVQFDTTPWYLILHPYKGGPARWVFPSGNYTTLVPVGSYSAAAWFSYNITDVKENVPVDLSGTISMSASNAIYPVQIVPTGADNSPVAIERGLQMRYFEVKDAGWSLASVTWTAAPGIHYFAPMSDSYRFEMSMLVNHYPSRGPSYLFHAYANSGVNAPITFQNSKTDFRHVINQHSIDPGLTAAIPQTSIALRWTGGGVFYASSSSCSDVPLTSPFQEESYLIPFPYPDFHSGYVKKTVYGGTTSSRCSGSWPLQYETPLWKAKNTSELDAYWYSDVFPAPPFSTTSPVLYSGVGPYSWYGKFLNFSNYVYINWGANYPFASQSRDVRPPTSGGSLPCEIYQNGSLIGSGSFSGQSGYFTITPNLYTLKFTMNNFTVNGIPGLATVNATFDMRISDPRPPTLLQLRLQKNGEPTNAIAGGELLQFEVSDDDSGIASTSLSYNPGNGWITLPLSHPSGSVYEAVMPAPLLAGVPVSIRIVATDVSGNILQFETQVASSQNTLTHAVLNDFDGDSKSDMGVYRPDNGVWYIFRSSDGGYDATGWGLSSDKPVPGDYDGDRKTDEAVFRPASGVWYVLQSSGGYTGTMWGINTDIPVPGDYDGDGRTDIAVWRPDNGTWYILRSSDGNYDAISWGLNGDTPVPGDYDGDGKTDIAVWRSNIGVWFVLKSSTPGSYSAVQWGLAADKPVPADYDGDGKTDIAVWRPDIGVWFVLTSGTPGSYAAMQWGLATDKPVPADYDGDGKADFAVWRPSGGVWYVLKSGTPGSYVALQWGLATDKPVPADYDGDGKADFAVWRPSGGVWYVLKSGTPESYTAMQWGFATDAPLRATP